MNKMFILPILFLTLSCSKDSSTPTAANNSQGSIMPLAIGNTWVMRTTKFDTLGGITSTKNDTISIVSSVSINNENWFLSQGSDRYALRSDGLWYWFPPDSACLLAKYPATANDSYPSYGDGGYQTATVVSTNASINVAAGPFSCFKYQGATSGVVRQNNYFALKTGMVKLEFYSTRKGTGERYVSSQKELVSVTLK